MIHVCDSISCWVCGSESVLHKLETMLGIGEGETTTDGRFTLLPIVCLGLCDQAPAMMIDGVTYGHLTDMRIEIILAEYE